MTAARFAVILMLVGSVQCFAVDLARWKQAFDGTWVELTDEDCTAGRQTAPIAVQACHRWAGEKAEREALAERQRRAAMPGPRLGMSAQQVLDRTSFGAPEKVNRTVTRAGVREQWVYGPSTYLYFENGRLTAIQD